MQPGLATRIGTHLDSRKAVYAQVVSGILFAGLPDAVKEIPSLAAPWNIGLTIAVLLTLCLFAYAAWETAKRTALVEHLTAENETLKAALGDAGQDFKEHCSRRLLTIGEEVGFHGADRISLYKHDGDKFIMLGRSAERPELKVIGRGVYPADQGVIGMAWRSTSGRCFVDDLPDPAVDLEAYRAENERRLEFPRHLIDTITMRSRTIAAYVLKDMALSTRVAIIIFESLEAKRFIDDELWAVVSGPAGRDLLLLMDAMKLREPSLSVAKRMGF